MTGDEAMDAVGASLYACCNTALRDAAWLGVAVGERCRAPDRFTDHLLELIEGGSVMFKMQTPASGCEQCGGPVRTWKRGLGWWCSKCAHDEYVRQGTPVAERRYYYQP